MAAAATRPARCSAPSASAAGALKRIRRAVAHGRPRRVSSVRVALRPLRGPLRPRGPDRGARRADRGLGGGARRSRVSGRARRPAARLRRPADAALPGRAGCRSGSGRTVYLKREDLAHTGAHKINNAVGQALLAQRMGKRRIIAETGAGQHGVATATACALLGLECVVYMGTEDMRRQRPNVERMELHGGAGRAGRGWGAHAQGGGQRRDPRLGHQRRRHPLHHRLGGRSGAVPGTRARPPAGDRRRGPRADPRDRRAAFPTA